MAGFSSCILGSNSNYCFTLFREPEPEPEPELEPEPQKGKERVVSEGKMIKFVESILQTCIVVKKNCVL